MLRVPGQIQWPSNGGLDGFVNIYDWDLVTVSPQISASLSVQLNLCSSVLPCALNVVGSGAASMRRYPGGMISCLASAGCTGVRMQAFSVICDSGAAPASLLKVQGTSLALQQMAFSGCSCASQACIVQSYAGAQLAIDSSLFMNIAAVGYGGAVSVVGSQLAVSNTTFKNSSSSAGGGAIYATSYVCYGSDVNWNTTVQIGPSCTFTDCSTRGVGGAVYALSQPDTPMEQVSVSIASSTFTRCASDLEGGAIFASTSQVSVTVASSSFVACTSKRSGGAITATSSSLLTAVASDFINNTALGIGGGSLYLQNTISTLMGLSCRNNSAPNGGGGVILWQGSEPSITLRCGPGARSNGSLCSAPCISAAASLTGSVPLTQQACAYCEAGKYSAAAAATACAWCDAGKYSTGAGSSACLSCPVGSSASLWINGRSFCGQNTTNSSDPASLASTASAPNAGQVYQLCGPGNAGAYGPCLATTYSSLQANGVPQRGNSVFPGLTFTFSILKKDAYNQTIATDSASALQLSTALANSSQADPSLTVLGNSVASFIAGMAVFSIAVRPSYGPVSPCADATTVLSRPSLYCTGLDALSLASMRSDTFEIQLSRCSAICPVGAVLQLDQATAYGRPGACVYCSAGAYSLSPLAGYSPGNPSCFKCPAGGNCILGGSNVTFALGSWIVDGSFYRLAKCPPGHRLINSTDSSAVGVFSHDAQQCLPCKQGEYILNQLESCQTCPAGAICNGVAIQSALGDWIPDGSIYRLVSCPPGHRLINSTDNSAFGVFSHGVQQCLACKQNEYIVDQFESCQACPAGAVCNGANGSLSGTEGSYWRREGDKLRVFQCDAGYVLVRDDSSHSAKAFQDACVQCLPQTYSLVGARVLALGQCVRNGSSDQPYWCPTATAGVVVGLNDDFVAGSWTSSPELAQQICNQCPAQADCPGGSIVLPKTGFWSPPANVTVQRRASQFPTSVSLYTCPPGACLGSGNCSEGRTGPVCGFCKPGWAMTSGACQQCPTDENLYKAEQNGLIALGVLLSVVFLYVFSLRPLFLDMDGVDIQNDFVEDQIGDSYNDNNKDDFQSSGPEMQAPAMSAPSAPRAPHLNMDFKSMPSFDLSSISDLVQKVKQRFDSVGTFLQGYFKVVIGFFQVLTTFADNFSVQWPVKVSNVFQGAVIFRFDLISLPGPSCIADRVSYKQKLLVYTLFPVLAIALLSMGPLLSLCSRLVSKNYKKWMARDEAVWNQFWYSLMFFLFLIYPTVSMTTLKSFDCADVGLSYALLRADYREICPYDIRGSAFSSANFIFWWSFLFVFVYPLGIPAFFLAVMWHYRIPAIASAKLNRAKIQALISEYRRRATPIEVEILVRQLTVDEASAAGSPLDGRIDLLFDTITGGGGEIALRDLMRFFEHPAIGLPDASEKALRELFRAKDVSGDGKLSLDEFRGMMRQVVLVHRLFTGHERLEDMYFEQLYRLYEFHANGRIHLEIEEESSEEKSLQDRLLGAVMNAVPTAGKPGIDRERAAEQSIKLGQAEEVKYPGQRAILRLQRTKPPAELEALTARMEPDLSRRILALANKKLAAGQIVLPPIAWAAEEKGEAAGKEAGGEGEAGEGAPAQGPDERAERLAMTRLGFLIKNYNVQSWYFELVEMSRKLFMTSVVTFVYQGSAAQLVAALVVTLLSLVHVQHARPFLDGKIGGTQAYALLAQCLTLVYGLVLIVQTLSDTLRLAENRAQVPTRPRTAPANGLATGSARWDGCCLCGALSDRAPAWDRPPPSGVSVGAAAPRPEPRPGAARARPPVPSGRASESRD